MLLLWTVGSCIGPTHEPGFTLSRIREAWTGDEPGEENMPRYAPLKRRKDGVQIHDPSIPSYEAHLSQGWRGLSRGGEGLGDKKGVKGRSLDEPMGPPMAYV